MIAGLSRAINLYLAPLLSLTSLVLALIAFLAPSLLLHTQVALLAVSPMQGVEGPSVFMGALGSCSRPSNEVGVNCTVPTVSPKYDLSVLPSNAPDLLSAPTATTPAFIAVSLAFAILFFILFTLTSFHEKMGKFGARLDKPVIHRSTAWIGLLGFMIGITSFLVLRMWFEKAVEDFNDDVSKDGSGAPQLVAFTSNGFVMVWIAYAFYAVPLVCSLAKLHVTAGKGGKA